MDVLQVQIRDSLLGHARPECYTDYRIVLLGDLLRDRCSLHPRLLICRIATLGTPSRTKTLGAWSSGSATRAGLGYRVT